MCCNLLKAQCGSKIAKVIENVGPAIRWLEFKFWALLFYDIILATLLNLSMLSLPIPQKG